MFSAEESVMDRLASQGREIFGLVWENTEGPNPVQVWRKKDRFEMRFGNRVVQSSCLREDPDQLVLSYTRHMMLCLLLVPEPQKVLHIGLGGGTISNFLHRLYPELEQTVIELNEGVLEAACQFFGFEEDSRRNVIIADAVEKIHELEEHYDLIFLGRLRTLQCSGKTDFNPLHYPAFRTSCSRWVAGGEFLDPEWRF